MSIRLETKTVFHCKCVRPQCGWEWDALKKPKRCAKCKYVSWNGEDQRSPNPFEPNGQSPWTVKPVPLGSRIKAGTEVPKIPRKPSYKLMLNTFTEAREVIDQLIQDCGPCDHAKNVCYCREKKLLNEIDRQIAKLTPFTKAKPYLVEAEA